MLILVKYNQKGSNMSNKKQMSEWGRLYFSENEFFDGKFNYIHVYLHKDYEHRMHSHQFYEINIISSGEGRHYIEDSDIRASVGDVFVIPPGVSHSYHSAGRLDIYHVLIKSDFLTRYAEELSEIEGFGLLFDIEPQIRQASGKNFNLNVGAPELLSFVSELERMMRVEADERYVYLNALTLSLICRLCRRISGSISVMSQSEIVAVMEYVKENLDKKLTLSVLAERANMSTATLNRRFREVVGSSPMSYVLSCRVSRARELIDEGNLNKTEIAHVCGFYDIAHMNKYL